MLRRSWTKNREGIEAFDRNRKHLGLIDEEEELPEDPEILKIERITPFQHLERLKKTVAAEQDVCCPSKKLYEAAACKENFRQVARKEREARQRKQDVDQKKAQIDAQQSREEKLLRKLLGIGSAEREEAHVLWEKRREKRATEKRDSTCG